jgi:hypothetical protein
MLCHFVHNKSNASPEDAMKAKDSATCGQEVRPASAVMSLCLPFCGLGAGTALQKNAARCGSVLLEQRPLRAGEAADAQTKA